MIFCRAYSESGEICMKPAEYLDEVRGMYVCEQHKPTDQENPHPKIPKREDREWQRGTAYKRQPL